MTWALTTLGIFLLVYGHAVLLFALLKVEDLILSAVVILFIGALFLGCAWRKV